MSSSNKIKTLETFSNQPLEINFSKILTSCKNVDQFKKLKRIGEGN